MRGINRLLYSKINGLHWPDPGSLCYVDTHGHHQYEVRNATNVWPTDAFARIEIYPDKLDVIFYSRKGNELEHKTFKFPEREDNQ